MRPTVKVLSASCSSMRVFQKRILSGSPSRSRGPGSSSRKKSASWASKDRNPFGTILTVWLLKAVVEDVPAQALGESDDTLAAGCTPDAAEVEPPLVAAWSDSELR